MKKKLLEHTYSLEAIAFQDPKFFDELTQAVGTLRAKLRQDISFLSSNVPEGRALTNVIKKHTNLNVNFDSQVNLPEAGFALVFPQLANGHIFNTVHGNTKAASEVNHRNGTLVKDSFKKYLDAGFSRNQVDLRKNWVSGFFSEMPLWLIVARIHLVGEVLSDREIAAITLHEVGHGFTICEYMNRTVQTNQILADIARATTSGKPDKITTMVVHASSEHKLNPSQKEALLKCKAPEDYLICAYAIADETSRSELGFSVYEKTSCEQLADMYATRCGAGRDLVTGLAKTYGYQSRSWNNGTHLAGWMFACAFLTATAAAAGVVSLTLVGITVMALQSTLLMISGIDLASQYQKNIYDSDQYRYERIKHQLIQRIKDAKLNAALQVQLIAEIESIEIVIAGALDENLTTLSGKSAQWLALMFNPAYRRRFDMEQLQKQLESLASNNLFVQAAKLRTL